MSGKGRARIGELIRQRESLAAMVWNQELKNTMAINTLNIGNILKPGLKKVLQTANTVSYKPAPSAGEIIKIECEDSKWCGCVVTVDRAEKDLVSDYWMIQCHMQVPGGGIIRHEFKHNKFKVIGEAMPF